MIFKIASPEMKFFSPLPQKRDSLPSQKMLHVSHFIPFFLFANRILFFYVKENERNYR